MTTPTKMVKVKAAREPEQIIPRTYKVLSYERTSIGMAFAKLELSTPMVLGKQFTSITRIYCVVVQRNISKSEDSQRLILCPMEQGQINAELIIRTLSIPFGASMSHSLVRRIMRKAGYQDATKSRAEDFADRVISRATNSNLRSVIIDEFNLRRKPQSKN